MAQVLVTVGTDDVWAPPQMVEMAFGEDFTCRNVRAVSWDIEADGTVSRVAMWVRDGWYALAMAPAEVRRGSRVCLAAGDVVITFHPPGAPVNVHPPEIAAPRRRLSGMRRLLSAPPR